MRAWLGLGLLALASAVALVGPADPARAKPPLAAEEESEYVDLAAGPARLGAMAVAPSVPVTPRPPRRVLTEGVLTRGQTLSSALRAEGVTPQVVNVIAREMHGHFDFRGAMPGHGYRLVRDAEGEIIEFRYRVSTTESYHLMRWGEGFKVSHRETALEPRAARVAGVITTTLYQAVLDLGENGQLARDFADIFAWDIDFQRSIQPGDAFQVLYERLYRTDDGSDEYVRPGRILAARYEGRVGSHTAVYFEPVEGRGGYYRPDGTSVEGAFLMAPLRHARITSSYSRARRHPILKVTRPHHGIDYAAAIGMPVWSVATGEVIYRGWAGGFGNLVKVKHNNGYVSYYAHLSRFAKGLRVGDRIAQKQVLGYVGQTGLATGPHVCFRVQKNGRYVNPAELRTPAGESVKPTLLATFYAARDLLLSELDDRPQFAGNR